MPGYKAAIFDCPWPFRVWNKDTGNGRSAESHYRTMTWNDLDNLGPAVRRVMDKDSCIFLWCCWPTLIETQIMMMRWGFSYKSCAFCYVKTNKDGSPFTGMGYWSRSNVEPVLLYTIGHPHRISKGVSQVIFDLESNPFQVPAIVQERLRHSQKPQNLHEAVEALVDGPRLEAFAREPREGWDCIGDEITGRDIYEDLEILGKDCVGALADPQPQLLEMGQLFHMTERQRIKEVTQ